MSGPNPTDADIQFSQFEASVEEQLELLETVDAAEAPQLARAIADALAAELDDLDTT